MKKWFDVVSAMGSPVCCKLTKQQAEAKVFNERGSGMRVVPHVPIPRDFDPTIYDCEEEP